MGETMDPLVSLVSQATLVPPVQTVHRVNPDLRDQSQQPTWASSPDTAKVRTCRSVPTELALSTTDTRCCTCRATKGRTDRTSARLAVVCVGSAPCPSCSATSTTSVTLPPAMVIAV